MPAQELAAEQNIVADIIMVERDRLREHHAEWFAEYDTLDPMKAPREACEALLRTAPTECTRGMIAGIMVIRSQMEAMHSATMGTAVWTQPTAVAARKGTAKAAD